jgi:hypothetical protein
MNTLQRKKLNTSESGVALIMAILVLMLVSAVVTGMILMSNTETNVSLNFRDAQTAFFDAKGGVEEVRDRLRAGAPASLTGNLPTNLPGQNNGVLYITNPAAGEVVAPWNTAGNNYPDDEICKEVACAGGGVPGGNPWYATTAASASYAAAPLLNWKWVRLIAKTNKSDSGTTRTVSVDGTTSGNRVCWNGTNELVTAAASCPAGTQQVYHLTSLAVTPSGSRRMLQMEVSLNLANLNVPSALTFDGPGDTFGSPNSNPFHINGTDRSGPDPGACALAAQPAVPAVGVVTPGDVPTTITSLNRPDHYTGAGATPSVGNVASNLPPDMQSVSALDGLVQNLSQSADYTLTDGGNGTGACTSSPPSLGTAAAPVTIYANCSFSLSGNNTGYGVLIVTGTYSASGNNGWRGLVLVVGQGNIQVNGGGNNSYDGGIVVAKTRDANGNLLATLGAPTVNWNGGGGNGIYYDSCWISNALSSKSNYRSLAYRELMY